MPFRSKLSNGAWIETQVQNGSTEVSTAKINTTTISHRIEVAWTWSGRNADIKVTSEIIQGETIASYTHGGDPRTWTRPFNQVQYKNNRNDANPLNIGNDPGQVVISCVDVSVFDSWTNSWAPANPGLQPALQVNQ
jgi:GH43 family beta-xylosidase